MEIDFVAGLNKVKDKVGYILQHYPKARDNDKYLYLVYLRVFTNAQKMNFESFDDYATYIMSKEVPCPETIRRTATTRA